MLVLLCAFAESCFGIGLFISGLLLVIVSSVIFSSGIAELPPIIALALTGATLGDHAGYYFGRWIGPGFHELNWIRKRAERVRRVEKLVLDYGPYAIFIGRFVPAVRSLLPAMLGISGFPRLRYSLLDLCACGLWSLALGAILLGIRTQV